MTSMQPAAAPSSAISLAGPTSPQSSLAIMSPTFPTTARRERSTFPGSISLATRYATPAALILEKPWWRQLTWRYDRSAG
ncbi:MAG: hypothetical protein A4E39_00031 [Methanoregulaceae archaeon PtaB.Bin152]|nr:MAG: hypothetical protein A4E39_00031 [Methanoregulaceae archaeon PtaB.Bin152]